MASKKAKNNPEELMKAQYQREKSLAQQHKNKMRPFVKYLKRKQLRFSHARVGNSRIEYFRIDQFEKILTTHQTQIQANQQLKSISKQIKDDLIFFKRPVHLKIKYPDVLQPVLPDDKDRKYASFRFDTTESKKWMTIGIILGVLFLVLFPVWPYQLKYGIWLCSLILLIVLVSLIVLRLVIYLICVIFGYNVWIFPNLMGDYSFLESFKPFIYYEKWEKDIFNTLIRVFITCSIIAYGCYMYLNPHVFFENIEITKSTVGDIHDWGVEKIKNQKNFSQRAITNLQDILNQTDQAHESSGNNQYTSFGGKQEQNVEDLENSHQNKDQQENEDQSQQINEDNDIESNEETQL